MTHRQQKMLDVTVLIDFGPPSSPPTAGLRRRRRIKMAMAASQQNRVTEKPKLQDEVKISEYFNGELMMLVKIFDHYVPE